MSNYRNWDQLQHAKERVLFPENAGFFLNIDGTSVSSGEPYTVLTGKERHGGKGSLVAIVSGTKSEDVIKILEKIPEEALNKVEEVTLDLSESMRKIVRRCFPQAKRVIDRFHVRKLAFEGLHGKYVSSTPGSHSAGNRPQGRSQAVREKTHSRTLRKGRHKFEQYPDIPQAYSLSHSLRMIFSKRSAKDGARLNMAKRYNKVEEAGFHSFNVIAATFCQHSEEMLNFYIRRSTNAAAESFNAKIKAFRDELRGAADIPFFLFRLTKLYA